TAGQWTVGQAGHTGAIAITGGTGPFTVIAQSNPSAGLSAPVTGTSATFTGAPATARTFANIHLTGQDAPGAAVSGTFALTVNNAGPIITGFAGTGTAGYAGHNGPATAALLSAPAGVAIDSRGDLFIADTGNNVVREVVKATGAIVTVA